MIFDHISRMRRFILSVAFIALGIGMAIGHYAFPVLKTSPPPRSASSSPKATAISSSSIALPRHLGSASPDSAGIRSEISANQIISEIKAALAYPGRQHTYAALAKLADSIDQKNVREVLTFVQTLEEHEKSMLVPLLIGRWAELDPQAAVAYAQNFPAGSFRNWALTSAIGSWAEHDAAAATAWTAQLSPG